MIDAGSFVQKSHETVGEFMYRWLDGYVLTNTRRRTLQGYRHYVRRHIVPALGAVPLQRLRAGQLQALYSSMLAKGLSASTVGQCHRILSEALSHGVMWGDMVRNPAKATSPPKAQKTEVTPWDAPTFLKFLETAKDSIFRDVYHLAVHTALRRSELCGLRWEAIDLETAELRVVKTLQRLDGLGLVEERPKRDRSRRTIALSSGAVDILKRVKIKQLERKLALGDAWQGDGHVFTGLNGGPISGERLSRDFAKIRRASGLPYLTLHGLRHTAVSLLIAGGRLRQRPSSPTLGPSRGAPPFRRRSGLWTEGAVRRLGGRRPQIAP